LIEVPVPSLYSMWGCPQPREPRFPQQFEENDVRNGLYSVAKIRTQ